MHIHSKSEGLSVWAPESAPALPGAGRPDAARRQGARTHRNPAAAPVLRTLSGPGKGSKLQITQHGRQNDASSVLCRRFLYAIQKSDLSDLSDWNINKRMSKSENNSMII